MNTFGKQALGRLMALMIVPTAAVRISAAQEYNFHGIGHLDNAGDYSEITAVSGDGEVVVGTSTSRTGYAAFVWTRDTGIQRLALPGGGQPVCLYSMAPDVLCLQVAETYFNSFLVI